MESKAQFFRDLATERIINFVTGGEMCWISSSAAVPKHRHSWCQGSEVWKWWAVIFLLNVRILQLFQYQEHSGGDSPLGIVVFWFSPCCACVLQSCSYTLSVKLQLAWLWIPGAIWVRSENQSELSEALAFSWVEMPLCPFKPQMSLRSCNFNLLTTGGAFSQRKAP